MTVRYRATLRHNRSIVAVGAGDTEWEAKDTAFSYVSPTLSQVDVEMHRITGNDVEVSDWHPAHRTEPGCPGVWRWVA